MAAESVLICVSGRSGVTVGAEKAYQLALKNNKARMIFVTKLIWKTPTTLRSWSR